MVIIAVDDCTDFMNLALNQALHLGARYANLKFQDTSLQVVNAENKVVKSVLNNNDYGMSIEVLCDGALGTAFTTNMSRNTIFSLVKDAFKVAHAVKGNTRVSSIENEGVEVLKCKEKVPGVVASLDEKKELLLDSCETALTSSGCVKHAAASFGEYSGRIVVMNSFGTFAEYHPSLSAFSIRVLAKEGEILRESHDNFGGSTSYHSYETRSRLCAEAVAKAAVEKLEGKRPPNGKYQVIIDPVLSGILAHESFGHLAEADFVLAKSSPLAEKLGEVIGTEQINVVDYGLAEGGFRIPFDDEGVRSSETNIVTRGILTNYLQSLETASILNEKPTGNARAQDYSCNHLVRMTNTYFDKGDWGFDEIIRETRNGIYAVNNIGGRTDMDGSFSFSADRAHLVTDGEIQGPLIGVVLSGNIFDVMRKIDAVGDDLSVQSTIFGACIKKGQRAFVGSGGPHLRIKDFEIGGE
jgi:TldD protein